MALKREFKDGDKQFTVMNHKRAKESKNFEKILVQISQTNFK